MTRDDYLVIRIVELELEAKIVEDLIQSQGRSDYLTARLAVCLRLADQLRLLRRRIATAGMPDIGKGET